MTDNLTLLMQRMMRVPDEFHPKINEYRNLLTGYQFNIILLKNASISVATEVFTRLNVGGKALSLFEIMVAKTYLAPDPANPDATGFDLTVRYEQLLTELRSVQYDTLAPATVLQIVAILAIKSCTRRQILDINKRTQRSFKTGLNVRIDNAWLSKSTSKKYHHFFPKAFAKKQMPTIDYRRINHIANITIVDDYLNKNDIRAKSPARYVSDFSRENHDMPQTLATHLIGDPDGFGITNNDYEQFFNARIQYISGLLGQFMISQTTDNQIQVEENEEIDLAEIETE